MAFAYGVCRLLGFLSQLVVGVEARLSAARGLAQGFTGGGDREMPPSQHTAVPRGSPPRGSRCGRSAFRASPPGLALDLPRWTSAGAGALALAVLVLGASGVRTLLRLRAPAAG